MSRWKGCPSVTVEVNSLELIANLVNSGAGYGIIPAQVVKSQRYKFKIVSSSPSFKDKLAPEMLQTEHGENGF